MPKSPPRDPLAQRKRALRQSLRRLREELPAARRRQSALKAARHLLRGLPTARDVAVYLAVGAELDTQPLIAGLHRAGCRVYAPRIEPRARMRFLRVKPRAPLRRNRFGIAEPAAAGAAGRLDAIVMPLVGFDAAGHRLGMGGGYYDRLLARTRSFHRPLRIGLGYAAQEVPHLPAAAHDARLDAVVTERGWRWFERSEG